MAPKRDDFLEGFRGTGWNKYSPGYQTGQMWKKALTFNPPATATPLTPVYRPPDRAAAPAVTIPRASSTSSAPYIASAGPYSDSGGNYSGGSSSGLLDSIAENLWPFSQLSNLSDWLGDGNAACRMLLACFAGLAETILIYGNVSHMHWMGALARAAIFQGYGTLCLIGSALIFGAAALPVLLSRALAIVIRVMIVLQGCAIFAGLCYIGYLLLVHFKVF